MPFPERFYFLVCLFFSLQRNWTTLTSTLVYMNILLPKWWSEFSAAGLLINKGFCKLLSCLLTRTCQCQSSVLAASRWPPLGHQVTSAILMRTFRAATFSCAEWQVKVRKISESSQFSSGAMENSLKEENSHHRHTAKRELSCWAVWVTELFTSLMVQKCAFTQKLHPPP